MVMFGNDLETKENKILTKDKIEPRRKQTVTGSNSDFNLPRFNSIKYGKYSLRWPVIICILPRTQTSLFIKMCAQRKAGRRQLARRALRLPCVPFPWSPAVHHQSLVSRSPPAMRKTKRLRRRLICIHLFTCKEV